MHDEKTKIVLECLSALSQRPIRLIRAYEIEAQSEREATAIFHGLAQCETPTVVSEHDGKCVRVWFDEAKNLDDIQSDIDTINKSRRSIKALIKRSSEKSATIER